MTESQGGAGPLIFTTTATRDGDQWVMDRETARNALGRPGRPEEIVSTALYLASPRSSFVTATTIRCDGGICRSQS